MTLTTSTNFGTQKSVKQHTLAVVGGLCILVAASAGVVALSQGSRLRSIDLTQFVAAILVCYSAVNEFSKFGGNMSEQSSNSEELRLLIDPSILLSEEGLSWLEDNWNRQGIVVPSIFRQILEQREDWLFSPFLPGDDLGGYRLRRDRRSQNQRSFARR